MIVGTAVCGIVFALFSGQPLNIIGVTGPILVFEENLYKVMIEACISGIAKVALYARNKKKNHLPLVGKIKVYSANYFKTIVCKVCT